MGLIINPQSELIREPNLLVPGKKPVGPVKIDLFSPLARDLRFFAPMLPSQNGEHIDLARNNKVSSWDSGITRIPEGGLSFNDRTDEIQIARHPNIEPDHVTVLCCANITDVDYGYVTLITKDKTSFTPDYYSYHLRIRTQTQYDKLDFHVTGTSRVEANTAEGSFDSVTGKKTWFAGTYDGASVKCYMFDEFGNLVDSDSSVAALGPITYWDTPMFIGEGRFGDTGDATTQRGPHNGDEMYYAAIWGHGKSQGQIQEIIRDPHQFLVPA